MLKRIFASAIALILTVAASSAAAQDSCYPYNVVNVERHTAIWDTPGFSGRVVRVAEPGSNFDVLKLKHESEKCWAQVEVGTALVVVSTAQVDVGWLQTDVLLAKSLPARAMSFGVDDRAFEAEIDRGLEFLWDKAPYWNQYVMEPAYIIEPCGPCPENRSKASWREYLSGRRVYIHEDTFVSPMRLARALVHESTHIHQGYEDRWTRCGAEKEAVVRLEKEAVARETEMVLDIDPNDPEYDELKSKWEQPESWWLGFVQNDSRCPSRFGLGIGPSLSAVPQFFPRLLGLNL